MNVEQCVQSLQLKDAKVVKKAKKLVQKLGFYHADAALPCEMAKEVACVFLAARLLGHECEVARAARCGASSERDLCRTATAIQNLLHLKLPSVDLKHLCARYGKDDADDGPSRTAHIPRPGYLFHETREAIRALHGRLPGARLSDAHLCAVFQLVWAQEAPASHVGDVSDKAMCAASATDTARYREIVATVKSVLPEFEPKDVASVAVPKVAAPAKPDATKPVPLDPSQLRSVPAATAGGESTSPSCSQVSSGVASGDATRKRRRPDPVTWIEEPQAKRPALDAPIAAPQPLKPLPPAPKQLDITSFCRPKAAGTAGGTDGGNDDAGAT